MSTALAKQPATGELMLSEKMAKKYSLSKDAFISTVETVCFQQKPKQEELVSFLIVSNEYDLNPLLREIYAFPKKGGGIQPIVGVDGWLKIANRHVAFDGMEFEDAVDDKGNLLAVKCRIHRKDRAHPIEAVEYMEECKRGTEPWKQMPRRMLRNRAICQAVRIAFGVSGIMNQDEFERWQDVQELTERPRGVTRSQPLQVVATSLPAITQTPADNAEPIDPQFSSMFAHCKTPEQADETRRDLLADDPTLEMATDFERAYQQAKGGGK